MNKQTLNHFLQKARDAKSGGDASFWVQSTGEKVAVALALNRPDLLAEMGYSLAEAIDRLDPDWLALVPTVERILREES